MHVWCPGKKLLLFLASLLHFQIQIQNVFFFFLSYIHIFITLTCDTGHLILLVHQESCDFFLLFCFIVSVIPIIVIILKFGLFL